MNIEPTTQLPASPPLSSSDLLDDDKAPAHHDTDEVRSHPEDWCQRCGGRNRVWFVQNELWNAHHADFNILCADCFIILAREHGYDPVWELKPETLSSNGTP